MVPTLYSNKRGLNDYPQLGAFEANLAHLRHWKKKSYTKYQSNMHVYQKSINDELFKLKWSYGERKFIPDKSCHHAFHLENISVKFTIIFIIENMKYNFDLFEVLNS